MKRTIENPKKVNHELFIILVIYAVMGIGLGQWFTAIDHNKQYEILTGIILNISYGCFASVIVAWIFEVNNVKHENETIVDEAGENLFWDSLDAINKDLEKYIGSWEDIEYYNNILFEAGKFF